jgi:hypothetical protein
VATHDLGSPASSDTPSGEEESDSQQPEYELIDRGPPEDTDENDSAGAGDEIAGQQPAYELVDHSPPPPDDIVIAREAARLHGIQRSWLLVVFC